MLAFPLLEQILCLLAWVIVLVFLKNRYYPFGFWDGLSFFCYLFVNWSSFVNCLNLFCMEKILYLCSFCVLFFWTSMALNRYCLVSSPLSLLLVFVAYHHIVCSEFSEFACITCWWPCCLLCSALLFLWFLNCPLLLITLIVLLPVKLTFVLLVALLYLLAVGI